MILKTVSLKKSIFLFTFLRFLRLVREKKKMTHKEFEYKTQTVRPLLNKIAARFFKAAGMAEEEEDTVQEVMLKLWQLSSSDYAIRDFKALAIRMTKNLCVSKWRKGGNRILRLPQEDNLEGGATAAERLEEAEAKLLSEKLISSLNETQKMYIRMRHERGLSLDEISAITGKPKTSVKSTISAARKQMLEKLKKEVL